MYPIISNEQYEADRRAIRAFPVEMVETRALFYARMEADGMHDSEIWRRCVDQLTRSSNPAIANEARRLKGGGA